MVKRRIALAVLSGTGLTALIALSLNIPSTPIAMIAALGLVPGGMIDSLMPGSGLGRAAVILACNALIYSAIAFVGFIWWLRPDTRTTKRFTLFVGPVVLALVALACIPKISPLWPRGMRALGQQEDSLRSRLPEGTRIEYARTVLHDQGFRLTNSS